MSLRHGSGLNWRNMETQSVRDDATGVMSIMGKEGDTKHYWNVKKWDDVQSAKEVFDLYRKKGYLAFSMNKKGDQGEQMVEFDPSAGSILFVPPMQGG